MCKQVLRQLLTMHHQTCQLLEQISLLNQLKILLFAADCEKSRKKVYKKVFFLKGKLKYIQQTFPKVVSVCQGNVNREQNISNFLPEILCHKLHLNCNNYYCALNWQSLKLDKNTNNTNG